MLFLAHGGEVFLALLGFFILLGTPTMLIIALAKLGDLQDKVEALREAFEAFALRPPAKPQTNPAPTVAVAPQPPPAPQPKPIACPVAAPPPNVPTRIPLPNEPTALDIFFAKIGDWIMVRGAFAPAGMTQEFAFATRWLLRIGALLIVASLAYFAKLSIDRGWMGPTGRVLSTLFMGTLGVVGGVALVKRTRYGLIGHTLAALGIVALYFGFGLGHKFFNPPVIDSAPLAFSALTAVTIIAGLIAVLISSSTIAVLGLLGGYLVPLIVGRDSGFPLNLDCYLLILNLGAFAVAHAKKWSGLNFLATMLAYLVTFVWCEKHPECTRLAILVSFIFITLIHALYMTSVILGTKARSRAGNAIAWAGLATQACAYLAWLAAYFRESFSSEITGLVLLALVAAYLTLATLSLKRGWADKQSINILLTFALIFLAIAPLLLFDKVWCTLCWSAIAVAASEAEARTNQKILGYLSLTIMFCAGYMGCFYLAPLTYRPLFSSSLTDFAYWTEFILRFIRLWSFPLAMLLIGRRSRSYLYIPTAILAFIFFTLEAWLFGRIFLPSLKSGSITLAWAILAFTMIALGILKRVGVARITALVLLAVSVVKLALIDTAGMGTPARVAVFAIIGVLLIVGAFLYIKCKERFEEHE